MMRELDSSWRIASGAEGLVTSLLMYLTLGDVRTISNLVQFF